MKPRNARRESRSLWNSLALPWGVAPSLPELI